MPGLRGAAGPGSGHHLWQTGYGGMLSIINASEEDYKKLTSATRNYSGTAKEMLKSWKITCKGA
ncbi:MAG: hypothetical protein ACOX4J_09155 [Anaerovoracaceae bacterium]